jgi:acyl-CoA thioesterase YciA
MQHEKVTSKLCMIKDLGCNGNLFGGNMLAWIDEAAAIYDLQKTCENRVVTVKFNEISFTKPVREGDIVDFYCTNAAIKESSITFEIYGVVCGQRVFATTCVFVAVDEHGNKKKIEKDYFGLRQIKTSGTLHYNMEKNKHESNI